MPYWRDWGNAQQIIVVRLNRKKSGYWCRYFARISWTHSQLTLIFIASSAIFVCAFTLNAGRCHERITYRDE